MKKEIKPKKTIKSRYNPLNISPRIISNRETDGNKIVAKVYDDTTYHNEDGDCS